MYGMRLHRAFSQLAGMPAEDPALVKEFGNRHKDTWTGLLYLQMLDPLRHAATAAGLHQAA